MDHQEAIRLAVVERYLLDKLPPPRRDEFEEHFFECQLCAKDLRVTAEFLDLARKELKRGTIELFWRQKNREKGMNIKSKK